MTQQVESLLFHVLFPYTDHSLDTVLLVMVAGKMSEVGSWRSLESLKMAGTAMETEMSLEMRGTFVR